MAIAVGRAYAAGASAAPSLAQTAAASRPAPGSAAAGRRAPAPVARAPPPAALAQVRVPNLDVAGAELEAVVDAPEGGSIVQVALKKPLGLTLEGGARSHAARAARTRGATTPVWCRHVFS